MENPNFLKQKYWNRKPFREASEKSAKKAEDLKSQREEDKIDAYIERIKKITDKKPELFRNISLYPKFITKQENITDDYVKNIILGNFAEMKGYARDKVAIPEIKEQILKMFEAETGNRFEEYEVPQNEKEQFVENSIQDQKASLDRWYEYLTGPESRNYPDEFRYWTFAEMLKLGVQDKGRKTFNKRDENTVSSFPPLNQQALARVLDEIGRKYQGKPSSIKLDDEKSQKEFKRRLKGENFGKLYGWALDYVNSLKLPTERLPITEGEWKKFAKGSDPKKIVDSILEFNTGWCIDGEGTAESYLSHSDVYIYYSEDENGESVIPRAAIINNGSKVSEVRGIIQNEKVKQHLDDYITPIVKEKLEELPGGEEWQESMEDMKRLAEIHFKHLQKKELNKDDLIFLYEIDKSIQGTGYGRDPRIGEIRNQRNSKEDMLIIAECSKDQIAENADEVDENTRAYLGQWNMEVFQKIKKYPNIQHLFESFPDKKIFMQALETDPNINSPEKAEEALKIKNIYLSDYGKDILYKTEFSQKSKKYELVRFTVENLGFPNGATTQEIYDKAEKLGLELCPAEVGPQLCLQSPSKDWMLIAMKQIVDRDGVPRVFYLSTGGDQLTLYGDHARPDRRWDAAHDFVFRFRKLET